MRFTVALALLNKLTAVEMKLKLKNKKEKKRQNLKKHVFDKNYCQDTTERLNPVWT